MLELPTEIIVDILSRLAVEPLLRFRCVSKPWCSLIDSPIFVKTHLNRSIENHTNLTLILGEYLNKHTLYSLDFHSFETPIAFIKPFNKNYFLLGSCNGLLLLEGECDQLVLFNPSTRHYRNLPENTIARVNLLVEKYGLGYDSFADDYKVIRVVYFCESHKSSKAQAEVYNLKSNSWRKIGDFPFWFWCIGDNGWGAHVNDALHMVVTESGIDSPKLIVAFGARDENFYTVPKPSFPNNEYDNMNVGELGGFLCTMCTYRRYRTDLWVMTEYGMKESWTKLLSNFTWCYDPLNVLCYLKSCDKILLNYNNQKLLWYDLKKRTACNARVRGLPNYFYSEVCVRSLVPLYGYEESGEPGKKHKAKE